MTSDRDKCGLSSLLPMSCRGRAEAFARSLHSRLRTLGTHDGAASETSWLTGPASPDVALAQPRHSQEPDLFFDLAGLESPGSPEDEVDHQDLSDRLLNPNPDNLKTATTLTEECHCSKPEGTTHKKMPPRLNILRATMSNDSDSSDGPFYDTENDISEHLPPPHLNGFICDHPDSPEDCSHSSGPTTETEDVFESTTSSSTTTSNGSCADTNTSSSSSSTKDNTSSCCLNGSLTELSEIDDPDWKQTNGNGETYRSCLSVEKELLVECPIPPVLTNGLDKELVVECSSLDLKDGLDEVSVNGCESNSLDGKATTNGSSSKFVDDGYEEEIPTPRVRRCSSLKTGKTPPGTPGRKKIVRFADVLGLDLADVRTYLDEIPKVPSQAYEDLRDADLTDSDDGGGLNGLTAANKFHGIKADKVVVALFQQPGGLPNFLDRVRENNVCLENAVIEDPIALSVTGIVRVKNLDFHKSVHIRYTFDAWQSYQDIQATYLPNTCDGFSDKFSFLMYANTLTVGQRMEFAVRFQCKGCQYWDNNNGANYCFQCLPQTTNSTYHPITGVDDSWVGGASFYYREDSSDLPEDLTPTDVQELISHSLGRKRAVPPAGASRNYSELLAVFVVIAVSFLFMYLQTAIYFTK